MFANWQGMSLRDEQDVDGLILDLFGLLYKTLNHFSLHSQ
jgi:hypothetical protein